jgi:undecaprenyl-diphosphatase
MKHLGAVLLVTALSGTARADDALVLAPSILAEDAGGLNLSYLIDGGMIPFFWAPMAGSLALDHWVAPRPSPMMFSPTEGGAPVASWQVPSTAVSAVAVGLGMGLALFGDESKWFHIKGLAESIMSSQFVSGALKATFGRHRPDWTPDDLDPDQARSFPSGHSTLAFSTATYAGLYLRDHVFDESTSPLVKGLAYSGLALGAGAIAGERVWHNRHNVSDVAVGAALGMASSYLFYRFQERRFEQDQEHRAIRNLMISPSVTKESTTIGLSFDW